jgi:hypothetical protein
MYGLLHAPDGSVIERQVRVTKVSFGVPKGPDVHVAIKVDQQNKALRWIVEVGKYNGKKRIGEDARGFTTKDEAKAFYRDIRKAAPQREYPRKLPYFTFLRMGIDGDYQHDFEAIEHHGPLPTELDVIFLSNEPFESSYQWWTAAELKCEGDGLDARRKLSEAKTPAEQQLAEAARANGERFFPILGGCYTMGCPYPRMDKPQCKPHGRLHFQLQHSPRIGGTCTYDTTGFRSISQLYSCIQQIKAMTGRGRPELGMIAGIPLKLVMRPYKTSHNGVPSVQFAVSLEFRAPTAMEVVRSLNTHSAEFQSVAKIAPAARQLSAAATEQPTVVDPEVVDEPEQQPFDDERQEATAMDAEFYGDFQEGDDDALEFDEPETNEPPPLQMPKRKSDQAQLLDTASDPP